MLPRGAHLTLYICHVFSSTIGLVNGSGESFSLCENGIDFTEYLAHARTDCAKPFSNIKAWERGSGYSLPASVQHQQHIIVCSGQIACGIACEKH